MGFGSDCRDSRPGSTVYKLNVIEKMSVRLLRDTLARTARVLTGEPALSFSSLFLGAGSPPPLLLAIHLSDLEEREPLGSGLGLSTCLSTPWGVCLPSFLLSHVYAK